MSLPLLNHPFPPRRSSDLGYVAGMWRLASAMCRDYWPVTLLAVIASSRIRKIAITMALADGLADWFTHRDSGGLDPVRYVAYKRLDDVAYGTEIGRAHV